jgi:hypothetical protein
MGQSLSRRQFVVHAGATGGAVLVGLSCSGGSEGGDESESDEGSDVDDTDPTTTGPIADADVPATETIFGWISEVFAEGIRRPGYPADEWAEGFIEDHFRDVGLEDVRREPVDVMRWEPLEWSLEVVPASGESRRLDCFPVPLARSTARDGLDLELAAFDDADPAAVAGQASLVDVGLLRVPADLLVTSGSAPEDVSGRVVDPDGTLDGAEHILPFGGSFQAVMEPSIEAGAGAFIGSLDGYPGDSHDYYVPYDGIERPIPGVWISGTDGAWLRDQLAAGPVRVRLTVEASAETVESHNIVGELPGADDEVVMVGSHHDGPWASAVEDGSGISLVLAQATYWAAQPAERRPHRMVFVLQAGHMSGGAGLHGYIEAHRAELARVVLEVHLEHACLEFTDGEGGPADEPVPTGLPVPRWFFSSRIPQLEAAVVDALEAETLHRSMLLAPDAFGDQPPTDGAFYHSEGVPIVHFLAAPFYLFDAMDTLDKIDRDNLVPLTRATIRIIESTRGVSAAAMRAAVVP